MLNTEYLIQQQGSVWACVFGVQGMVIVMQPTLVDTQKQSTTRFNFPACREW
jgi:NAD/NADP transhydrogenase beta subunit